MLVLASASPRRRELIAWLVREWAVEAPDVDENAHDGETPSALVRRLARTKAAATSAGRSADWVLAADTIVEIDGTIFGKPRDEAEAGRMLGRLAGREHRVVTGFVLLGPGGSPSAEEAIVSRVRFRPLTPGAIAAYVASGEPSGKAGGYAIQGRGAALVAEVVGSLSNVIGLPLEEVARALAEAGLLDR